MKPKQGRIQTVLVSVCVCRGGGGGVEDTHPLSENYNKIRSPLDPFYVR